MQLVQALLSKWQMLIVKIHFGVDTNHLAGLLSRQKRVALESSLPPKNTPPNCELVQRRLDMSSFLTC